MGLKERVEKALYVSPLTTCEKCNYSNQYTHSSRCEEHKDLPAGYSGAVTSRPFLTHKEMQDLIKDQQARINELEDDARFIWRWIERGQFDKKHCTPKGAVDVLANYPNAPWNKDRKNWDTSHKEYNADIDNFIAKQALSEAGE